MGTRVQFPPPPYLQIPLDLFPLKRIQRDFVFTGRAGSREVAMQIAQMDRLPVFLLDSIARDVLRDEGVSETLQTVMDSSKRYQKSVADPIEPFGFHASSQSPPRRRPPLGGRTMKRNFSSGKNANSAPMIGRIAVAIAATTFVQKSFVCSPRLLET